MTATVSRFKPGDRVIWWARHGRSVAFAPMWATVVAVNGRRVRVRADGDRPVWVDDTVVMHPTD